MARGYSSAPGASPEVEEARKPNLHRASIAMHGRSKNGYVREIIAEREDCPFGLMVTLAHDRVAAVRAAVARNPAAARGVLEHLAEDRDSDVLIGLVNNPALPEDVLERLVFSKRPEVRDAAALRLDGGGLTLVAAARAEDDATPELREAAGEAAPGLRIVEPQVVPGRPQSPFTRTAPVRGFSFTEPS